MFTCIYYISVYAYGNMGVSLNTIITITNIYKRGLRTFIDAQWYLTKDETSSPVRAAATSWQAWWHIATK